MERGWGSAAALWRDSGLLGTALGGRGWALLWPSIQLVSISANHILPFAELVLTTAFAISMDHLFPFYRQETEGQAVEVNLGSSVNKGSRLVSRTPNIVPRTLRGEPILMKSRRIRKSF